MLAFVFSQKLGGKFKKGAVFPKVYRPFFIKITTSQITVKNFEKNTFAFSSGKLRNLKPPNARFVVAVCKFFRLCRMTDNRRNRDEL